MTTTTTERPTTTDTRRVQTCSCGWRPTLRPNAKRYEPVVKEPKRPLGGVGRVLYDAAVAEA